MKEDLSRLSEADIDALPFGYIALAPDGTIRKYNRYEADLARKDPQEVLGKNFFRDVAPCTQVKEFEGRFRDFAVGRTTDPTLSFNFDFAFRHGTQKVRIGFVRSPLDKEIIVTVNRLRDLSLPLSAELHHEPAAGLLFDGEGRQVATVGADFWQSLMELYDAAPQAERSAALERLGRLWGRRHALRVESFVQREHAQTLREVELHLAFESLSGSIGVLGLGHFDVDLRYRNRGLLLVTHDGSPFATSLTEHDGTRCDILSGLYAGFLSYLSGRELSAREIDCSASATEPCRFVVATQKRLHRFFNPASGSSDAHLWLALGIEPPLAEEADDE